MSAAVCYFLVYFSEALILLQYSSNVFEYKISSIKRYILLYFLLLLLFFLKFQPWKIVQLSFSILLL